VLILMRGAPRRWKAALAVFLACVLGGGRSQTGVERSDEELKQTVSPGGVVKGARDAVVLRQATFYVATGGWTVVGWSGVVGPVIRYKVLCAEDDGDRAWFWSAPPGFLSALPEAFGATLEIGQGFFEVNRGKEAGLPPRGFDVSIESDNPQLALRRFNLVRYASQRAR
jgi:hypothetical protein